MTVPGALYSLLIAVGAWAVDYLTTGGGAGIPWAPLQSQWVPVILKMFTVQSAEPAAMSRSAVGEQPSKMRKFLLG